MFLLILLVSYALTVLLKNYPAILSNKKNCGLTVMELLIIETNSHLSSLAKLTTLGKKKN